MRSQWSALLLLVAAAACSDRTVSAPASPTLSFDRVAPGDDDDRDIVGGVFTETDDPTSNAVVAFARHADGTLAFVASYPTGGRGLGGLNVADPLQSQFAVVLTPDHRYLFAVNAASNSIAAFAVDKKGLEPPGTIASNGNTPVSLAATNHVLYALNKYSNTVTGFQIDGKKLIPVPSLTRSLSPGAGGGAAIRFDPDERLLAVTERTSNTIDVFTVRDGVLSHAPVSSVSESPQVAWTRPEGSTASTARSLLGSRQA